MAGDPLEVDLVAGEEEQHAEPEVGEELDEVGHLQPEHLRPDHDAEHELDDDRGNKEATPDRDRRDGAGDRGRRNYRQERRWLDFDRGEDGSLAHARRIVRHSRIHRLTRKG